MVTVRHINKAFQTFDINDAHKANGSNKHVIQSNSDTIKLTYILLFLIKFQKVSDNKTVHHLKYTAWDKDEHVPNDAKQFVDFVRHVETLAKHNATGNGILVHCM